MKIERYGSASAAEMAAAKAFAELVRFLGLPERHGRWRIVVDDLSVGVTLVSAIGEPLVCQSLDELSDDIVVVGHMDPETGTVHLIGWSDPAAFRDDCDRIERDGDVWYSPAQENLCPMERLKAQGEPVLVRV
jgi:hypothetical protein